METGLYQFEFDFESLGLTRDLIAGYMGYEKGVIPDPFPEMIDQVLSRVPSYCDIRGGYKIFEETSLKRKDHQLIINEQCFEIRRIITYQLRKAEKYALFICTAGKGIGEWSRELMKQGDLIEGYVVDIVGSEIVEIAMDRIQDILESDMHEKDLGITDRFSPGYCGWEVSEQPKLFSFFPENFCGVSLSPSCLMDPIKSVSGVIGIGPSAERKGYLCDFCKIKNCIYRKEKAVRL